MILNSDFVKLNFSQSTKESKVTDFMFWAKDVDLVIKPNQHGGGGGI